VGQGPVEIIAGPRPMEGPDLVTNHRVPHPPTPI
jgi:hypothetical protein